MDRRLYRSRKNRVIAGVAGGLGEYFDIDPVLVRVIFVLATLASGFGVLAYLILWIVVPFEAIEFHKNAIPTEEGAAMQEKTQNHDYRSHRRRGSVVGGTILVVLGGLFLMQNYLPQFSFSDTWPLILVAIGAGMVFNSLHKENGKEESHEG
ncbi:MAG: PspC domain-containing protein [Bacteroidetes bacterium]|nr:PspC domain-containing protein [Bacteroidota bacterium]